MNHDATARPTKTRPANTVFYFVFPLAAATTSVSVTAADWPQWGGPTRDFKVASPPLADRWPLEGPRKLWNHEIGEGYSGIVVRDDKLYTMYRRGEEEAVLTLTNSDGKLFADFQYPAKPHPSQNLEFGSGPNATPLLLKDSLVTVGFTGIVYCTMLDTGKPTWRLDLVKDFGGKIHEFGYSSSPLAYRDLVILLVGGEKTGVVAVRQSDGTVAWKSKPFDVSYASPLLISVDGQDQIVFMSSTEVIGIRASDGAFVWSHPCVNEFKNNAADPVWGPDNLLWVATQQDAGTRVLRLSSKEGSPRVKEVWTSAKIRIFHWNAIHQGGFVYAGIGDGPTFLAAVDIRTGKIGWRNRGFTKPNCILADGKLIILDEDGVLALVKATPDGLAVHSKIQLLDKVAWTTPSLVDGVLYVRDKKRIMALDLKKR